MKITKIVPVLFFSLLFFNSCKPDEDPIQGPEGAYENGFFVLNEGNFSAANASITYISDDYATVEQGIFRGVNAKALGDTAQSIFMYDDKAYIIVNGSDKIEVVNRYTMKSIATVEDDLENPRYIVAQSGVGYVSNWGNPADPNDDFISVIDLGSDAITGVLSVDEGPEKMLLVGDRLYVALKGAWNTNNKILVIDTKTNLVVSEIEVGDNPNSMYSEGSSLYVLSGGISYPELAQTPGRIDKIDMVSNTVIDTWNFGEVIEHPNFLMKYGNSFYYYLKGNIFKWDGANVLPSTPENGLGGLYYGVSINNGLLYSLDAGDFTSEGTLKIFDLTSNTQIESITTGVGPNSVAFN